MADFDLSGMLSNFMGSGAGKVAGTAAMGAGALAKQGPMGLSALMGVTGGKPLGMSLLGSLGGMFGGGSEQSSDDTAALQQQNAQNLSRYGARTEMHLNAQRFENPANSARFTGSDYAYNSDRY